MKTTPSTGNILATPKQYSFQKARKCGAKTRNGRPCLSPAVKGKRRCRMHGGKGSGAPCGNENAVTHGDNTTLEAKMERRALRQLIRSCKQLIASI